MSNLTNARNQLAGWVYIAGSVNDVVQDIQNLDYIAFNRKYGTKFASNDTFKASIRRLYKMLEKSRDKVRKVIDKRYAVDIKNAYQNRARPIVPLPARAVRQPNLFPYPNPQINIIRPKIELFKVINDNPADFYTAVQNFARIVINEVILHNSQPGVVPLKRVRAVVKYMLSDGSVHVFGTKIVLIVQFPSQLREMLSKLFLQSAIAINDWELISPKIQNEIQDLRSGALTVVRFDELSVIYYQ